MIMIILKFIFAMYILTLIGIISIHLLKKLNNYIKSLNITNYFILIIITTTYLFLCIFIYFIYIIGITYMLDIIGLIQFDNNILKTTFISSFFIGGIILAFTTIKNYCKKN